MDTGSLERRYPDNDPREASRMGTNGRRWIVSERNRDAVVCRMVESVTRPREERWIGRLISVSRRTAGAARRSGPLSPAAAACARVPGGLRALG